MTYLKIGVFAAAVIVVVSLYVAERWRSRRMLERLLAGRERVPADEFGSRHYNDATRAEIAAFVLHILEDRTGHTFTRALPADAFVDDLHIDELDSLVLVEIITEAEKRFSVTISDVEAERTRTIDDFVQLVHAKLARHS
jgi:acyl carrier protein